MHLSIDPPAHPNLAGREAPPSRRDVLAELSYLRPTSECPVSYAFEPPPGMRLSEVTRIPVPHSWRNQSSSRSDSSASCGEA